MYPLSQETEGKIPGQIDEICTEQQDADGKEEHPGRGGPIQPAPLGGTSGLDNKPTK